MQKRITLGIILLSAALNYLAGQELKVKDFRENLTDISARENQVLDINSNPCALVKIYTGLKGLVIEGNRGVERTQVLPGVVWVWLPEGTKQLKISREGMPMFVYSLPMELKSSTVYSFELQSDKVFSVIINTGNVSADVTLGGKNYKTNTTIAGLLEDKYHIRIQKLGYHPVEDTIEVNESNLYFSYTLQRTEQGVIKVNSTPAGAVVLIDGEHVGETNFSGYRFPGVYHLQITLTNYIPVDTTISFDPSVTNTYNYKLIRNTGFIKPVIFPTDADISIDGSSVFPGIKELSAGSGHSISITKYRYRTINEPFALQRGDTLDINITLEPEQGDFSFVIEPNDAKIRLKKSVVTLDIDKEFEDKKWTGSTQMTMPAGEYSLEAKRKGYLGIDTAFAITDAKTKYLGLSLVPKKLSRGAAFFASLAFPGMGQFYSQRSGAGACFFTAGLLSSAASGYYFSYTESKAKSYNELRALYEDEKVIAQVIVDRIAMDAAYQEYLDASKIRNICLGVTAGIWFINLVDATAFTKMYKPIIKTSAKNNFKYSIMPGSGISSAGATFKVTF